jgi:hypothetical protein
VFSVAHLRRLFAYVLILLALAPSFAIRVDDSSVVAFFFNSKPHDVRISPIEAPTRANFDCDLSASPRQLDDAQVSPFCVFHVEMSSAFLNPTTTIAHKNRALTVAVGRAPPAA